MTSNGVTYPVLIDLDGWPTKYSYYGGGWPHTAIINGTTGDPNYRQWQMNYERVGYPSGAYSDFITAIENIQGTPPPPVP